MEVLLDGRLMTSRDSVHDLLREKLSLPSYYGRNLDALYDLLTTYPEKLNITVTCSSELLANLGNYGNALISTIRDAAREHPNITATINSEIFQNNS